MTTPQTTPNWALGTRHTLRNAMVALIVLLVVCPHPVQALWGMDTADEDEEETSLWNILGDILTWALKFVFDLIFTLINFILLLAVYLELKLLELTITWNPSIYPLARDVDGNLWGTGLLIFSFLRVLIPFLELAILLIGAYFIFIARSPKGRAKAKLMLQKMILATVLITASPAIYQLMLDFSGAVASSLLNVINTEISGGKNFPEAFFLFYGDDLILGEFGSGTVFLAFLPLLVSVLFVHLAVLVTLLRYIMVLLLGIFFPLTLFLYFFDLTSSIGRSFGKATITWIVSQVVMVAWIAISLSLLQGLDASPTSFQAFIGLTMVCLSMILIALAPLMMTGLLDWLGALVGMVGMMLPGIYGYALAAAGGLMRGQGMSAVAMAGTRSAVGKVKGRLTGGAKKAGHPGAKPDKSTGSFKGDKKRAGAARKSSVESGRAKGARVGGYLGKTGAKIGAKLGAAAGHIKGAARYGRSMARAGAAAGGRAMGRGAKKVGGKAAKAMKNKTQAARERMGKNKYGRGALRLGRAIAHPLATAANVAGRAKAGFATTRTGRSLSEWNKKRKAKRSERKGRRKEKRAQGKGLLGRYDKAKTAVSSKVGSFKEKRDAKRDARKARRMEKRRQGKGLLGRYDRAKELAKTGAYKARTLGRSLASSQFAQDMKLVGKGLADTGKRLGAPIAHVGKRLGQGAKAMGGAAAKGLYNTPPKAADLARNMYWQAKGAGKSLGARMDQTRSGRVLKKSLRGATLPARMIGRHLKASASLVPKLPGTGIYKKIKAAEMRARGFEKTADRRKSQLKKSRGKALKTADRKYQSQREDLQQKRASGQITKDAYKTGLKDARSQYRSDLADAKKYGTRQFDTKKHGRNLPTYRQRIGQAKAFSRKREDVSGFNTAQAKLAKERKGLAEQYKKGQINEDQYAHGLKLNDQKLKKAEKDHLKKNYKLTPTGSRPRDAKKFRAAKRRQGLEGSIAKHALIPGYSLFKGFQALGAGSKKWSAAADRNAGRALYSGYAKGRKKAYTGGGAKDHIRAGDRASGIAEAPTTNAQQRRNAQVAAADHYSQAASRLERSGDFKKAATLHEKAAGLHEQLGDAQSARDSYLNSSQNYSRHADSQAGAGNVKRSLASREKAAETAHRGGDAATARNQYGQMSNDYRSLGKQSDGKKKADYAKQADLYAEKSKTTSGTLSPEASASGGGGDHQSGAASKNGEAQTGTGGADAQSGEKSGDTATGTGGEGGAGGGEAGGGGGGFDAGEMGLKQQLVGQGKQKKKGEGESEAEIMEDAGRSNEDG